ncbi:MAG: hypothetical protein WBD34_04420 [Burkholderiaceae bacterium]
MVISVGEKVHVVYRAIFENSSRRHFLGQVTAVEGVLCRLLGYAFVYDPKASVFVKRLGQRTTNIDLAESGYIVNVVDSEADIDKAAYHFVGGTGLVVSDGGTFSLDINEFGSKS